MKTLARAAYNKIVDLLFPIECLGCESPEAFLCEKCMKSCAYTPPGLVCVQCGSKSAVGGTHPKCAASWTIDGIFAATSFKNALARRAIKKLKYRNVQVLAVELAGMLAHRLELNFRDFISSRPVIVASVPLHAGRRKTRGYNQSELIGQELASILGLPYRETLIRIRATKDQTRLNKKERGMNVKNAFAIAPGVTIAGKTLLVVDDVTTTGATLRECAKALKRAGAEAVWGVAVAKD